MTEKLKKLWATKNKNDEWWSSFVTAPLAIGANYFAVDRAWITPNGITLASFVTALVAGFFIVIGGSWFFIAAAILIHLAHVLDCMDGQMARYRRVSSPVGSYFDRLTDQLQVIVWFGAAGFAAYSQSASVLPLCLAFVGVAFYGLRGYTKYVAIEIETARDPDYPAKMAKARETPATAGLGFGLKANVLWFLKEQPKIIGFDEGVFIFMLSAALILDALTPMLLVFAASQLFYGLFRALQHGGQIGANAKTPVRK
jgi:phosphatidylglycerophosphate synthase